jgi:ABC-2 type transport system permease protein
MKALDIAIKDLIRSTRNFFLIGMALAAPLLITALLYFALGSMTGGDVSKISVKVGVVNADTLPADLPLQAPLGDSIRSTFFDESVKSWISASDYASEVAARQALDKQEIGVVVIIPATFTNDYFAGKTTTPVRILQDPTLSIGPAVVRDIVTSTLDGVTGSRIAISVVNQQAEANGTSFDSTSSPAISEKYKAWYTEFQRALFHTPEQAAFLVSSPGASGGTENSVVEVLGLIMAGQLIFFSFFTGGYAMMSILEESEEGTLPRLFTTPTGRTIILAGKFLAVFMIVMLQGIVLLAAGYFIFKIDWGQPGSVTLSLLGQMIVSVGLGVLLISFIKTSKQAGPILGGVLAALGMLSGLFTTNINMPASFNALGNFTPQGWVLKTWKLALAGQPPSELIVPFMVLLAMGVLMFAIGAFRFQRRFA